jgi:hypothetical protein
MAKFSCMRVSLLFVAGIVFASFVSCKKDRISVQENPAKHNHLIEATNVFNTSNYLSVISSCPTELGAFYYIGVKTPKASNSYIELLEYTDGAELDFSNYELGLMAYDGHIVWNTTLPFYPQDIITLPVDANDPKRLLIVGSKDKKGIIAVYDSETNMLVYEFETSIANCSFQSITEGVDNTFFVSGVAENYYPYLVKIKVGAANWDVTILLEKVFVELYGLVLSLNGFNSGQGNLVFLLADLNNGVSRLTYLDQSFNIIGSRYIPVSLTIGNGQVVVNGDKLFIIGNINDTEKNVNSSGSLWQSGVVYCYSAEGALLWERKVPLSEYKDGFYNIVPHDDVLFLAGVHSEYCTPNSTGTEADLCYSNGLLVKLSASTGEVLREYTFSNDNSTGTWNRSSLFHGIISGNYFHLWGHTDLQKDKDSDSWWIRCSLSEL